MGGGAKTSIAAPESRKRPSKPPSETAALRDDLLSLKQTQERQFDPLQTSRSARSVTFDSETARSRNGREAS